MPRRSPPSTASGSAMRSTGRRRSESSPVSSKVPDCPARSPARRRSVVPELAQSIGASGSRRPRSPTPSTRTVSTSSSCTVTPNARSAAIVASVSSERPKWRTSASPSPTAPSISARCEIDLSPGTAMCPTSVAAGWIFIGQLSDGRCVDRSSQTDTRAELARPEIDIASDVSPLGEHRRDDDAVSLGFEERGRTARLLLAADKQRERPASVRRDVLELEVLDVDPLGAERLGNAREHARAIRHVHAELLELARIGVGLGQHAAAVAGSFADPAGEEAGVSTRESRFELLDPTAVLAERFPERSRVLEEDVDPDARVRAGDSSHVAERSARSGEGFVAVDAAR